jgi:hypothetical protein
MTRPGSSTVWVNRNLRGTWEVVVPDRRGPLVCKTLDDARRVGRAYAARTRPCELVIRDAYHRVIARDLITAEDRGRGG